MTKDELCKSERDFRKSIKTEVAGILEGFNPWYFVQPTEIEVWVHNGEDFVQNRLPEIAERLGIDVRDSSKCVFWLSKDDYDTLIHEYEDMPIHTLTEAFLNLENAEEYLDSPLWVTIVTYDAHGEEYLSREPCYRIWEAGGGVFIETATDSCVRFSELFLDTQIDILKLMMEG